MKMIIESQFHRIATASLLLAMSGCMAEFDEENLQEARHALTTVFSENFESSDVTGSTATDPAGWATFGHPDYVGLVDVDSGIFTTPYGSQGMKGYTVLSSSGAWGHAATTSSTLNAPLAANTQYTLTFNVAANVGRPTAHYQAELVAVDDATSTTTVLASVRGNNDGTTDMSYSDTIIFTPDASHASLLGQRIAIRLGMDHNYNLSPDSNYRNNALFDNVVLATSEVAVQYTPNQADWSTLTSKPITVGNTSHDPDGVFWISQTKWANAAWDGTVYNPSQMTNSQLVAAICPTVDTVRGIREVFYQHNPFADVNNPTKAEIDEWHRIAINHVRALVGYTSEDRQVKKDHCMFARALWGDERKYTTMWDAEYPNDTCQGSTNPHCGATFIPDLDDQLPYLPDGHPGCTTQQGAEGVFGASKSNIPWSIKWSRSLCNTLIAEGFWGGHVGPWFHREKFGFNFRDSDPANNNSIAGLRAKWTGNLMPNLYPQP